MGFFDKVSKVFGHVSVKTQRNLIKIGGIDGTIMQKHIKTLWESDPLAKHMFSSITTSSVTIHEWFIPDLVHMLEKLRNDPDSPWGAKRTIDRIIEGIETNTWWSRTLGNITPMVDLKRLKILKYKPMPKQLEFLNLYGDKMPRYDLRGYIIAFSAGGGKAQPLDAKIRTPTGWETMGDMRVGSKVIAPDGTTTTVTGVYPQGKKFIQRIIFEDGRSTECCEEHLWKVYNHGWGTCGESWRVVTTSKLMKLLKKPSLRRRLYVELPKPQPMEDVELPIDPYVMGLLLGDGHFAERNVCISSGDQFIIDELRRLLPEGYEPNYIDRYDYRIVKTNRNEVREPSTFLATIRDLGLTNSRSDTKFIPDIYMEASPKQRLALIQGLMDADGTVSENGSASFCTVSQKMADQFQELIRSLGGLAKSRDKVTSYTYNGEKLPGKMARHINIRIADPKSLFRLPRKRDALPTNYQYKDSIRLRIRDIVFSGRKEAQCISVDHPDHLYITDDYIVTHNTLADLMLAASVVPPSIAEVKIIISPKKALHEVWEKTVRGAYHKTPEYWCSDSNYSYDINKTEYYIFGYEQLTKAIELGVQLKTRGIRFFVIIDEGHNFADPRSTRTQQLVKLLTVRDDIYFIWTTGTPILKSASELVSFMKCADRRFDDDAERKFKKIWSASPGRANAIFNHRLGNMMAFIVPKSEFRKEKPRIVELPVRLPSSLAKKFLMSSVREEMKEFIKERLEFYSGQMKGFRQVVNDHFAQHERTLKTKPQRQAFKAYIKNVKFLTANPDRMFPEVMAEVKVYERRVLMPSIPPKDRKALRNALSAVKNIKLKVRGEALGKILSKRRSECAAAIAMYCKPEEIMNESLSKTLFFASSLLPVKTLHDHLRKNGYQPMMVYADTNKQLSQIIDKFDNDPNANPICATMQSLSEAVPVTSASTVVLLNRPYRQAHWDQVVARADRIGQLFPVTVIEPVLDTGGEPNVSSTTDDILNDIRAIINEFVGEEFAGPPVDEREYKAAIDHSEEDPEVLGLDDAMVE